MKIINPIEKTCYGCPTQYQGKLADGRMFYVRYRWGYLSISVSEEKTDDVMDAVDGEEVLGEQLGDGLDGYLDDVVLPEYLKKAGFSWDGDFI